MTHLVKRRLKTTLTHTGSSIGTFHTITHNWGTRDIKVQIRYPNDLDGWCLLGDFFHNGANRHGFQVTNCTPTEIQVQMFRWDTGTETANYTVEVILEEDQ